MSDSYFSQFQGDVILLPPLGRSINWPTDEGREVGKVLADAVACPTHQMCVDCVFRHGSFPNCCPSTVDDAMLALIDPQGQGAFICNHPDDGGKNRVCGGYQHATKHALVSISELRKIMEKALCRG